ncbi:DNA-binding response regulator [Pandoraea apista]|uniref:AraC family transcriptional regulator n=2 Tax=Pandoraea apista TaxID=93218 RepID=A0A0G4JBX5_9BURK|nr:DNA-binding response regulator [Pandoraea apista]OXS97451.1 DNA-binding response regulator [Pandoraea apista]PTD98777.1 DNA-binding response regulator [Pandoraea apista]RRJ34848.1 DNA-binding response regulator [Pandoraea apista]RRJ80850.1 DNA-binding response regulator [Pandoraea apista]
MATIMSDRPPPSQPFAAPGTHSPGGTWPTSPHARQLSGVRVLVVDDNQEDRMLLMDFLSQQGCRVYIAQDGRDGYTKARTVQPDLILMDIRMPVCDGLGACRLLKADPGTRHIPLIFLTAAALPGERVAGLSAGAVDYVAKPYDFEEVRLRLSIHLKATTPAPLPGAGGESSKPTPLPVQAHTLDAVLYRATRTLLLNRLDITPELAGLASAVGTNTRRLNLAFRRCVGVTVFDFLREERMKEARRLLSETSLDVQDIASAVGFASAANFATAFRERFGMPPSGFRELGAQSTSAPAP